MAYDISNVKLYTTITFVCTTLRFHIKVTIGFVCRILTIGRPPSDTGRSQARARLLNVDLLWILRISCGNVEIDILLTYLLTSPKYYNHIVVSGVLFIL